MPKLRKSNPQKGFVDLGSTLLILLVIILAGAVVSSNIKTSREFSQTDSKVKGVLIAKGDESGSSGSGGSGSGSSGSDSSGSSGGSGSSGSSGGDSQSSGGSSSSSGGSGSSGNTTIKTDTKSSSTAPRVKTEESTQKTKTEIKFSETDKVKTRVEEGRTRIDVYQGGVKVRYEIKDGKVVVKAETEEGAEVSGQKLFKIEERLATSDIRVATAGGELVVTRNSVGALSGIPLQINLNTNELIASTSAGVKTLTILPDQAVQNMIAANIISKLNPLDVASQAKLGNITSVQDIVTLGERNGLPVYEINGLKEQRLLGFIPLTVQTKVFVSAETGQAVAQEQSLLANIIDLLSP